MSTIEAPVATAPATSDTVAAVAATAISPSEAARHFAAKLRFETDPSDVKAALDAGERFALVDSRGETSWRQGRIPGAIHLPTAQIAERAAELIDPSTPVVVYCWGPGCNGSTRAALQFSLLGYDVTEMIGGFEYWAREGLGIVDDHGRIERPTDELTAPVSVAAIDCDC
ncbi:rhodanese-like domain-containing protein [Leifsonia poae]|uniref:Sulfurtransferase n=1 Tax=Leifsonia poae TaxID=110933 RepID=A0A9W6H947_9MICO|nr:rhodanese-like domain-containing protein [Leifsonia poae]GLJ75851.1 sulfurtransferase [Leifsonia poae]